MLWFTAESCWTAHDVARAESTFKHQWKVFTWLMDQIGTRRHLLDQVLILPARTTGSITEMLAARKKRLLIYTLLRLGTRGRLKASRGGWSVCVVAASTGSGSRLRNVLVLHRGWVSHPIWRVINVLWRLLDWDKLLWYGVGCGVWVWLIPTLWKCGSNLIARRWHSESRIHHCVHTSLVSTWIETLVVRHGGGNVCVPRSLAQGSRKIFNDSILPVVMAPLFNPSAPLWRFDVGRCALPPP